MDKLRVQSQHSMMKKQATKVKRSPMKIVYIGNPMMFKAKNCFEFRQIVQQLTGQDSPTETRRPSAVEVVNKTPPIYATPKATTMISVMDEIEIVDGDSSHPSSSISSPAQFVDDFLSLEMFDGFQYPFLDL